jgi:hypothetical protein
VSQARSTSTQTLGATLERDRLEHRVSRIAVAVAALRRRATEHPRETQPAPQHIGRAIVDFEAQMAALNARLRDLRPGQPQSGNEAVRMTTVTDSGSGALRSPPTRAPMPS